MANSGPASDTPLSRNLGRFALIERLGQGGMGVVYAAYDPQLDRRVALKLLRPGRGAIGSMGRQRLLREAQALARLAHPNVVPIHDVGIIDEQVFLVMEYVPGEDLQVWLAREPRSWREIVDVYCQAGRGLAAAHEAGMIHRDFKPANARIGADGRVRVLDFGLARGRRDAVDGADGPGAVADAEPVTGLESTLASDGPTERTQSVGESSGGLHDALTETGALLGTPAYMAPEQFTGATVGSACDQFSFCVALYEALYGHRPFAGDSLGAVQAEIAAGRIRQPQKANVAPSWLLKVLRRGLATPPDDRYASMNALMSELDSNVAGDIRKTRRPVLWFLGVMFLAGAIVPVLFIPDGWRTIYAQPVPIEMSLYLLVLMVIVMVAVFLARRMIMATDISRKMVALGFLCLVLLSVQRTMAWYREVPVYLEVTAEFFTATGVSTVAALTVLVRMWWCALWTFAFALALALWPAQTVILAYAGFSGLILIAMAMWVVSSRSGE